MDVKSCAKLAVLMLLATIALPAYATEVISSSPDLCKVKCLLECAAIPKPKACYLTCFRNCIGASMVETFESHCNLDCMVSNCFDPHPDAIKVEGCVNSCSDNCKKS